MTKPQNAMELFQLLDKSNCRKCGEKTCLAFAGKVFMGQKRIDQCPRLSPADIARYSDDAAVHPTMEENQDEYLAELKRRVATLDLEQAAARLGGRYQDGKLAIKVLGKDFSVNAQGALFADIHVNMWVAVPFLNYVLNGIGKPPTGDWAPFRELKEGKSRYPLFERRCEAALKHIADTYTGLFDDMVHIFGGREVDKQFASDISVVLHPLPLVPMMVCYWRPEDGLASSLNLFFDRAVEANLDIDSLFFIGTGFARMFEKLAMRHGFAENQEP